MRRTESAKTIRSVLKAHHSSHLNKATISPEYNTYSDILADPQKWQQRVIQANDNKTCIIYSKLILHAWN